MLVCHCRVVSDRAIRAAVAGGACDLQSVADRCGAGGECGGCVPTIEELLEEAVFAVAHPDEVATRQSDRRCPSHPVPHGAAGFASGALEELEATA